LLFQMTKKYGEFIHYLKSQRKTFKNYFKKFIKIIIIK
jgi:hypothetical protein